MPYSLKSHDLFTHANSFIKRGECHFSETKTRFERKIINIKNIIKQPQTMRSIINHSFDSNMEVLDDLKKQIFAINIKFQKGYDFEENLNKIDEILNLTEGPEKKEQEIKKDLNQQYEDLKKNFDVKHDKIERSINKVIDTISDSKKKNWIKLKENLTLLIPEPVTVLQKTKNKNLLKNAFDILDSQYKKCSKMKFELHSKNQYIKEFKKKLKDERRTGDTTSYELAKELKTQRKNWDLTYYEPDKVLKTQRKN